MMRCRMDSRRSRQKSKQASVNTRSSRADQSLRGGMLRATDKQRADSNHCLQYRRVNLPIAGCGDLSERRRNSIPLEKNSEPVGTPPGVLIVIGWATRPVSVGLRIVFPLPTRGQ